jgi:hypothetical protein
MAVAQADSSTRIQVIAIYTFAIVMWDFRLKLLVPYLVIISIWLFLIIFIAVTVGTQTHGTQHYMAPAGVSTTLL